MLRITKLADYGIVLLTQMAMEPLATRHNARDLAAATHLPLPVVSKILKTLVRRGLLLSQRGVKGGYALARDPSRISIAQIIEALEGTFGLTECATHGSGLSEECRLEWQCRVRPNWLKVNAIVRQTLDRVPLSDMVPEAALPVGAHAPAAPVPSAPAGNGAHPAAPPLAAVPSVPLTMQRKG